MLSFFFFYKIIEKNKLICYNNGVVYASCTEAAAACELPVSYVSKQLSGKIKKTADYVFVAVSGNETDAELAELQRKYLAQYFHVYFF